jgi:hypothetical protein
VSPPGAGSFAGDVYTAPPAPQEGINVIATSVEDPNVSASAPVTVKSECKCFWTARFGGVFTGDAGMYVPPVGMSMTPSPSDLGPPSFILILGQTPTLGAVIPATVNYDGGGTEFWGPQDPDVDLPLVTISHLVQGEYVVGHIVGELQQLVDIGPPAVYLRRPLNMTVRVAWFDPLNPSSICE